LNLSVSGLAYLAHRREQRSRDSVPATASDAVGAANEAEPV
jgi:hypothetical protein